MNASPKGRPFLRAARYKYRKNYGLFKRYRKVIKKWINVRKNHDAGLSVPPAISPAGWLAIQPEIQPEG